MEKANTKNKIFGNIGNLTEKKTNNITRIIKGSFLAIILSILFLFIYATILTYTDVSETTMVPIVITITAISILIGSSISAMKIKKQGILNGAMVGLIYMLFIYLLSSIAFTGFYISLNSIIMIIVGTLAGMIGGVIGVNIG